MHVIRPKVYFSCLLAALAVLVISQSSLATTLPLDITTVKGVTQIGSVTTKQVGNNVEVTIALNSGYLLQTDDGYVMFDTTGGLKLTKASLAGFSVSKMSHSLSQATTIGGFTFTDIFRIDTGDAQPKAKHSSSGHHHDNDDKTADKDDGKDKDKDGDKDKTKTAHHHHQDRDRDKENQILLSSLTFTILNANVHQINGFGLQFCVADEGRCGKAGFAETSSVSTVPEPGTLALLGTGLVGIASMVRRRRNGRKLTN